MHAKQQIKGVPLLKMDQNPQLPAFHCCPGAAPPQSQTVIGWHPLGEGGHATPALQHQMGTEHYTSAISSCPSACGYLSC